MKKQILLLVLIVSGFTLSAQNVGLYLKYFMVNKNNKENKVTNKLFPEHYTEMKIAGKDYIPVIMRIKPDCNLTELTKLGCIIKSNFGKIYTVLLPVENLEKIVKIKDIDEIEVARKVGIPNLKDASEDINADYVRQGIELPQGYTGKGVILGDSDWGIDYTHPIFYDTTMTEYRIIGAWDQFRIGGTPPEGFNYGSVFYSKEDLLAAGCDTNNIYERGNHATHVGGIMGGGGAGTPYIGIACGSDLLFASWLVTEDAVLDSYSWMRNVAKERNQRLVINNSWGIYQFGCMDGTSMFDEAVKYMSDEDSVIFTSSAGNNGNHTGVYPNFHIKARFSAQDTLSSNFEFSKGNNYWGQSLMLIGDSIETFSTKISVYNWNYSQKYFETECINANGTAIPDTVAIINSTDSVIYRVFSSIQANGRPLQQWDVRVGCAGPMPYKLVLSITGANGNVHAWNIACLTTGVGNWGANFNDAQVDWLKGDYEYSIGEPAIGDGMIAVAAYQGQNRTSTAPSNIAPFSSTGPNLNGAMKPEIAAPGYNVVSGYSSFTTDSYIPVRTVTFNGRTYPFVKASGTSMSCPMVSGVIALMLEANPKLTSAQVREILIETAREDSYTGICPNYTWGYGKIDAVAAVKEALKFVSITDIYNDEQIKIYPNPAFDKLNVETSKPVTCVVYDIEGRKLIEEANPNSFINIDKLKTGIYFVEIISDNSKVIRKFIKK
ncbi:MAG: S8 family peptidase [Bacteroidales bacterium]|jgi:subtilisin family serine protease|nr:S8 family peptidase [Bacteroidales bacterium]